MDIKLENVRLSFPTLFNPEAFQGEGKKRYSATFIIDPEDKQVDVIEDAIESIAAEKWKDKAAAVLKKLRAQDRACLRDGDLKSQDGFEGKLFISASNGARPTVINRDRTPLTEDDGVIYGGCTVNAILNLWAMDNQFGQRINATLLGVQFVADGEAFGGGRAAADASEFDDMGGNEVEAEADVEAEAKPTRSRRRRAAA